jgi:hypothetical protein
MKKSTILIAGTLVLVVIGAYVYLKGKKSTTPNGSPTSTNTTTNTTSGTSSAVDSSMGSPTSSVVNSSLGLPTTSSPSSEEQKNYLKAKDLARALLLYHANTQNDEFKLIATKYALTHKSSFGTVTYGKVPLLAPKLINGLGYKVLPNYDIEKM